MADVMVRVTQVRSKIERPERDKRTLEALGLKKMNAQVTHKATPAILGMISRVSHLVKVEEV